jgi:molybdopterin synthase sulfur carrier subunit
MSVTVYIPTPFRRATANQDRVAVAARDVRSLLDELESSYDGLKGLVRDPAGAVHRHINISVNGEPIEGLGGLGAPLRDGDEVAIIPALAGGEIGIGQKTRVRGEMGGPCQPPHCS